MHTPTNAAQPALDHATWFEQVYNLADLENIANSSDRDTLMDSLYTNGVSPEDSAEVILKWEDDYANAVIGFEAILDEILENRKNTVPA